MQAVAVHRYPVDNLYIGYFFVTSARVELTSHPPQGCTLSVELRGHAYGSKLSFEMLPVSCVTGFSTK